MLESLKEKYTALFNNLPQISSFSPGRVNLIGEHTDYNNGFVFPMTVQYGSWSVAGENSTDEINIFSTNAQEMITLKVGDYASKKHWSDYLVGCLANLQIPSGFNMVITGNVPQGAGLSSSASFELSFIKAMDSLFTLDIKGEEAALIGQKSEHEYVGCKCGIMDQFVSALGQKQTAMLIDCEKLSYEAIQLPSELDIIVVNSNVKRGLVDSQYNQRRETCESAARKFKVKSLRELDSWIEEQAHELNLTPLEIKRARHVVSENKRAIEFKDAFIKNDIVRLFSLLEEAHLSLKNDFEVSTKELDCLVDLVTSNFHNQASARMTGGGFGGCVVILSLKSQTQKVIDLIHEKYSMLTGLKEDIYIVQSVDGSFCEKL